MFYASRLINGQGPNQKDGKWDYNIGEVYMIAILDNFVLDKAEDTEYFHDACWKYGGAKNLLSDKCWIYFLELLNFKKAESALDTELDKWLYALKNMSKMDEIPVCLQQPIFKKLFNIAEYIKLTKEEQMSYDQELKNEWDNNSALAYAKEKGIEEGREEGREEGIEEVALKMKKRGFPVEEIAKATDLSIENIAALSSSL